MTVLPPYGIKRPKGEDRIGSGGWFKVGGECLPRELIVAEPGETLKNQQVSHQWGKASWFVGQFGEDDLHDVGELGHRRLHCLRSVPATDPASQLGEGSHPRNELGQRRRLERVVSGYVPVGFQKPVRAADLRRQAC